MKKFKNIIGTFIILFLISNNIFNVSAYANNRQKIFLRKRNKAVYEGLIWLQDFFQNKDNQNKVSIYYFHAFSIIATTTKNQRIKKIAIKNAKYYAKRLNLKYLRSKNNDYISMYEAMSLLSEIKYLGLRLDLLLEKVKRQFNSYEIFLKKNNLQKINFSKLSEDELYDSLINSYVLEKISLAYPNYFYPIYPLKNILIYLKNKQLISYNNDKSNNKKIFFEHAYLATHIAYVLNDYGKLILNKSYFLSVYKYLENNFNKIYELEDIELIGEIIGILRSLGYNEINNNMIYLGTKMLLRKQKDDGSWGNWEKEKDSYSAMHYTTCALFGLRGRSFHKNTEYANLIKDILMGL